MLASGGKGLFFSGWAAASGPAFVVCAALLRSLKLGLGLDIAEEEEEEDEGSATVSGFFFCSVDAVKVKGGAGATTAGTELAGMGFFGKLAVGSGACSGLGASASSLAYLRVHSRAVVKNSCFSFMYCWDMSPMSPSAGLGSAMSRRMVTRTVPKFNDGVHPPFGGILRVSKHIRPPVSIFG